MIATAEGVTLDNLIKVTIFVTSIGSLKALRQVLYANYGESLPASSLVEVSALFSLDLHIEIEAVLALQ